MAPRQSMCTCSRRGGGNEVFPPVLGSRSNARTTGRTINWVRVKLRLEADYDNDVDEREQGKPAAEGPGNGFLLDRVADRGCNHSDYRGNRNSESSKSKNVRE